MLPTSSNESAQQGLQDSIVAGAQTLSNSWPTGINPPNAQTRGLPGPTPFIQPTRPPNVSVRRPTGTPGQSSTSDSDRAAYLGESGYMSIFTHDVADDEDILRRQDQHVDKHPTRLPPVLQESYVDTYFEYCYTWCPILDRDNMQTCPEFSLSTLLREALGILGSQLKPPLIKHPPPDVHFRHFRRLFYDNHETQPLVRICAVMLLYWWSAGPPNVVSIDTNWWWMGAAIRLAQEIGLNRERSVDYAMRPGETDGLRRRIWWTLFVCAHSQVITRALLTLCLGTGAAHCPYAGTGLLHRSGLLRREDGLCG